jgi:hypothetical protein
MCKHGRRKAQCKDCGGSGMCKHGRRKAQCKDCGGSGICEHGRLKAQCKDCGGSAICEHGHIKYRCKACRAGAASKAGAGQERAASDGEDEGEDEDEDGEVCRSCRQPDSPEDNPILLCDGCDAAEHQRCAGVEQVPEGDWFCSACSQPAAAAAQSAPAGGLDLGGAFGPSPPPAAACA